PWRSLTTAVTSISGCSHYIGIGSRSPLLKGKRLENGAVVSRRTGVGSRIHLTNPSKKRFMCSRFRQPASRTRLQETVQRRRCGPRMERSFFIWKLKTRRLTDFLGSVRPKNLTQSYIG